MDYKFHQEQKTQEWEDLGKLRIDPGETQLRQRAAETRGSEREEAGKSGCCSAGRGKSRLQTEKLG